MEPFTLLALLGTGLMLYSNWKPEPPVNPPNNIRPNQVKVYYKSTPVIDSAVKSAHDDIILTLPGLEEKINFKQYSGYLRGDSYNEKFVHYWFVESDSPNPAKDPVLLWLNGGPGCSSMEGLMAEVGPFQVQQDGKTIKLNPYSWNKKANILFLESPIGVGFSFQVGGVEDQNDDTTAQLNYNAIKSFMEKFPKFQRNRFFISGESYAGVYLPTLAVLLNQDNEINFQGMAIGNGYLDTRKLSASLLLFGYNHGLYGRMQYNKLSKMCCNGKGLSRESCEFMEPDYNCENAMRNVSSNMLNSRVNPYNIYAKCEDGNKPRGSSQHGVHREFVDYWLMNRGFNLNETNKYSLEGLKKLSDPPCVNSGNLFQYFNRIEVQKAIHVYEKKITWDLCSAITYSPQYPDSKGGMASHINKLMESKRNLTILIYNGDVDAVCNFLGDEWFVDDLGRNLVTDYTQWKMDDGQVGGYWKQYDRIAYTTIRGSGHMVPQDKPQAAFYMIDQFFKSKEK